MVTKVQKSHVAAFPGAMQFLRNRCSVTEQFQIPDSAFDSALLEVSQTASRLAWKGGRKSRTSQHSQAMLSSAEGMVQVVRSPQSQHEMHNLSLYVVIPRSHFNFNMLRFIFAIRDKITSDRFALQRVSPREAPDRPANS